MNGEHFVKFEKKSFSSRTLALDNHWFEDCTFEGVTFLYAGGPFRFVRCQMKAGCSTILQGGVHWALLFVLEAQKLGFYPGISFEPPPGAQTN